MKEFLDKLELQEKWPLYGGIAMLVMAGALLLANMGYGVVFIVLSVLVGIVMIVAGLMAGGIGGIVGSMAVFAVCVRMMMAAILPSMIILALGGAAMLIWYRMKQKNGSDT